MNKPKKAPERLRYYGDYLIEYMPGTEESYHVYDLRNLFESDRESFQCASLKDAERLCAALTRVNA